MADINGTAGADHLFGAAAADLILGGDGNDIIYGGDGDDDLRGGEGDDVLFGETGDDRLDGGAGNDNLSSTDRGDDVLLGGDGNDTLYIDRIQAGDTLALDGGTGNDRLIVQLMAAAAGVTAAGGEGDDSVEIFALRSSLALSLGAGRDLVSFIDFRTSVQGGGRVVISDFQAGAAGDRISFSSLTAFDFTGWNPATNPFAAGYLKAAQSGADVVISASFTANGTFVDAITLQNVTLASLTPDNLGGWTWDGSAVPAQTLSGTAAAETLRGNGGADEISGLDGDDLIEGHAGNDILWGGEGNDILRGGQGADQLHGGGGDDLLSAETAGDALYGEDGDDRLSLSAATGTEAGILSASGGAGSDSITLSGSSTTVSFAVDTGAGDDIVVVNSLAGAASITLGDGRDQLDLGNWVKSTSNTATVEVTDFATGDGGDRLEWTGFLVRNMFGWLPGDYLFANGYARLLQSGADVLLQFDRNGGGDQYVTLVIFRNADAAAFTSYNLGGLGPLGFPAQGTTVIGTADPDRLFGTDSDDVIEGLDGRDTLFGFHGDDELRGGAGDDTLNGYDGDDVLEGGDGNDILNPGRGDDLVDGGEGNDVVTDGGAGSVGFVGGGGDDSAYFSRFNSGDQFVGSGGDGNDYFSVRNVNSYGQFIVDGGAGDDIFDIGGYGQVTLGAGRDLLRIVELPSTGAPGFNVLDFAAGEAGDRLDFSSLFRFFAGFDPSANPFETGHLQLTGSGSDTYVMVDIWGPNASDSPVMLAVLVGVSRFSLTSHNLGGYAPPFTIGTGADETFQGNGGLSEFIGGGGNDTFLIGYGGNDVAVGGAGNDLFYVATGGPTYSPVTTITGGGGSDILQVQGKAADSRFVLRSGFGASSFESINATGIATVQFLSGFDASRGWALNAPVQYRVTLENGFAPTGAPLVVDTTRLAAGESLLLENGGIPDSDASITLIGGPGADRIRAGTAGAYLDGAGGDDELHTTAGNDTLLGGAGADLLVANLTYSQPGADLLDAGEGNDTISLTGGGSGAWTTTTVQAGAGNDLVTVDVGGGPGVANVDLGSGDDRLQLRTAVGTFTVTLGAGRDTIEIVGTSNSLGGLSASGVTITDFDAGPDGDTLNWGTALNAYLAGTWNGTNPFETGHARLLQDGGDVLLQVRRVAQGDFLTLLRLKNHAVADFAGGIGGFVPVLSGGTAGDDILVGTGGPDTLDGKAGNDSIDGGAGADRMTGGLGNDLFFVDDVGDEVIEAAFEGTDEVRTTLASYSFAALPYLETLRGMSNSGQALTGNGLANLIYGGGGSDILTGLGGSDRLDGGAGADTMRGGTEHDVYIVDDANDVVEEYQGEGIDQVITGLAAFSLFGSHVENLTASSDAAHEFRGSSANNVLSGGGGDDVLLLHDGGEDIGHGGQGNDVLYFGASISAGDFADGGFGRDAVVLQGNVTVTLSPTFLYEIESLSIQSGSNARFGDTANNFYDYDITLANHLYAGQQLIVNAQSLREGEDFTFDGSAETDGRFLIYGGHGTDDLTGGGGVDVFFFEGQRWTAGDKVDGGDGRDALVISAGSGLTHIEFAADSFVNIESISVNNRYATDPSQKPSYELVLHNGNVTPGATLIVNGSSIALGQVVNIDGRGVHDGALILFGGGGHDVISGGAGADLIIGGGGQDSLTGGAAADIFRYDSVSDSPAGATDLIADFQTGIDKVDLSRIDANSNAAGDQAFTWIGATAFSGVAGQLRVHDEGGYRYVEGDTNGDGNADFAIAFYTVAAPQVQGDFML